MDERTDTAAAGGRHDWIGYALAVIAILIAIVVVRPEEVRVNLGRWGDIALGVSRYLVVVLFPVACWLLFANRRARRALREDERRLAKVEEDLGAARTQLRLLDERIADFRAPLMGDTAGAGGHDVVVLDPTIKQMDFAQARDGVRRLAAAVGEHFPRVELLVGVDSGGAILAGLLGKMLGKPVTCMTVGLPLLAGDPLVSLERLKGRRILLLDDASRSGKTMDLALKMLDSDAHRPAEVKTAVLLNIPDRKKVGHKEPVDFYALASENITVKMPWGTRT